MNKSACIKVLMIFICIGTTNIYSQNVPTTLEEMVGSDNFELQYVSSSQNSTVGGWMQGTSMPHPRYYGGSVMYTRNDTSWLYVLGGDTTGGGVATASCLKYNLLTDTWKYIAPLPEPLRTNASAILGDKIYTMGGFNAPFPSPAVASFYEYDINADSWTQLPDLPEPMFFAGAEGFEDSLIYIIGGMQDNVPDSDLLRFHALYFNTHNNAFTDATPMPEGSASFGHSIVGRSIYVQAGLTGTSGNFFPNDITLRGKLIYQIGLKLPGNIRQFIHSPFMLTTAMLNQRMKYIQQAEVSLVDLVPVRLLLGIYLILILMKTNLIYPTR